MRKIIVIFLSFVFWDSASASCKGVPPSDVGVFEVLANKKATVACAGKINGALRFAGCVLEVRLKSHTQSIKVYSTQKEICDYQPKQQVEMYINTACCGFTSGKILCSDFPEGDYGESPFNDAYGSCDASNARYVHLYRREQNGKSVVRFYNEQKKIFEDSKFSEIKAPKKTNK